MRKILFSKWDSFGQDFVIGAFQSEGFDVVLYKVPKTEPDTDKRGLLAEDLVRTILSDTYEFVFTVNFLPVVAIACKACKIKYVSWIYDSPCIEVFSETVAYDTNYVFLFDKKLCFDMRQKGIETVYYLPMAADVHFFDGISTTGDNRYDHIKYGADISFVGSLLYSVKPQFMSLENEDGYIKGYLDGLVKAQKGVYGYNFLEQALSADMVMQMQKLCMMPQRVNSMESIAWIYANYYLARKVTALERIEIITMLSERFSLKLYTDEDTSGYPQVKNLGWVDYYSQAPQVFKSSKINLNITLRSIQSGIPLRAFDIMGCGGFLLTNFQQDFLDYFVPEEDFVYYENYEDLISKVSYYLEHEDERARIAGNGYEKVKQAHTYRHRVREMLQIVAGKDIE